VIAAPRTLTPSPGGSGQFAGLFTVV
jgi:hypothetical protein